jgi:hypothetical protein
MSHSYYTLAGVVALCDDAGCELNGGNAYIGHDVRDLTNTYKPPEPTVTLPTETAEELYEAARIITLRHGYDPAMQRLRTAVIACQALLERGEG